VISGTLTQINADLSTLSYSGNAGVVADSIDIVTADDRGGTDEHHIAINLNAPPITTVPAIVTAAIRALTPLTISVADADAVSAGETIEVDILAPGTELFADTSAPGGGGVIVKTFDSTAGGDFLQIAGTLKQVDADLSTLHFIRTIVTDAPGIEVDTGDGRGAFNHQLIALNQPPEVIGLAAEMTVQEGVAQQLAGSMYGLILDEAGETSSSLTLEFTASKGLFSIAGAEGTVTGSGTNHLTITGNLAAILFDQSRPTYLATTRAPTASTSSSMTAAAAASAAIPASSSTRRFWHCRQGFQPRSHGALRPRYSPRSCSLMPMLAKKRSPLR